MEKEKNASLKFIYKMLQAEQITKAYEQATKKSAELLELLDEESNGDWNNRAAQNAGRRVWAALELLKEAAEDINTIKKQLKDN